MIKQLELFKDKDSTVESLSENQQVVGLFAGIGGVELGLQQAGWHSSLMCEIDPHAKRVLSQNFSISENEIVSDVKDLRYLPKCGILAAGFPCQDLSQAGNAAGIGGARSGLVGEVFRLLKSSTPKWVLLENVPFMLSLDRGKAMQLITDKFEELGYRWAYRTINTRSFGIPHRRERVIFIASKTSDPRVPLLNPNAGMPYIDKDWHKKAIGFYWTEGLRGVGWAIDHVPPIKCGSTVSIPSPPAIWLPDEIRDKHYRFIKPTIIDAERLQGFPRNWTLHAKYHSRNGDRKRWSLVGNAVSVPITKWIGERLLVSESFSEDLESRKKKFNYNSKWPDAAWGSSREDRFTSIISKWPVKRPKRKLYTFLDDPLACEPLSKRASMGFLERFSKSNLSAGGAREKLIEKLNAHIDSL